MEEKMAVMTYWNSKKITIHRKITPFLDQAITRTLGYYSLKELQDLIDFYATILEPGVPERDKKYFWTYKWNLWEFLQRGVKKFDGQEPSNYLRRQNLDTPEAVVFTRKK